MKFFRALFAILALSILCLNVRAQAPAEIPALSQDYAQDILSLFSWGLDIRFTEAEKTRFIKERLGEWESGNNLWQCQFIGDYWTFLIMNKQQLAANKEPMKKRLLDFVQYNAKDGQPDILWIQKRLGQDDEVEELPISKARRAPLEKMQPGDTVDTMNIPSAFGGELEVKLYATQVSNCLSKISEMLLIPFTPEQRQEFVIRAKKHWRKYREDWGDRVVSLNKNPLSYVNDYSTYFVYKSDPDHNLASIRSFTERGERDAVWLVKIYENAWQNTPLIASEPGLTRRTISAYASLRSLQANEVIGTKATVADVPAILRMQKDILAKWPSLSAAKKTDILQSTKGLFRMYQVYPHFTPLYQEHEKHLWGLDMVASMPQIKPIVDARSKEFASIAKKDPNWKANMERNNEAAFKAFLQKNDADFQRQMKMMDRIYDSVVFSGKINAINNAILRAPSGSSVRIDVRL